MRPTRRVARGSGAPNAGARRADARGACPRGLGLGDLGLLHGMSPREKQGAVSGSRAASVPQIATGSWRMNSPHKAISVVQIRQGRARGVYTAASRAAPLSLSLSQHPDQHRSEDPILLAGR